MPSRRQLLHAVAAAVGASHASRVFAAKYDLLITGGRVIDPAGGHDAVADVAISQGRIAAIARNLPPADAASVLDARGRIVTPGLVDLHVHMDAEMPPDTISSDLTAPGRTDRVFDFPTVLSKFLMLGMSLDQVVACATVNAARAVPSFRDLGTLAVGAPADVAVFELRDGAFEFVDNERTARTGRQKLVPHAVIARGARVV